MLSVSNLKKSFGSQTLFEDITFVLSPGERVGLVGRNGHGKSTLFRMILGEEHPDSGIITWPKDYKIGHLSQHLSFTEPNILDEACLALPLLDDCWKETYKAEAMLHGLGFSENDFSRSPSEFSGGFQIRLNLAKLLLSEPNLLLLDEPTNYLDIVSVRWLERFLQEWAGEAIIITHDRTFMDMVTTHTLAIHRGKTKKVEGSTEKLYQTLAEEEELYEKTRLNEDKKRKEIEKFVVRFRAKASKAKSVQSRVKQLEKMEVAEELSNIDDLDFSFRESPFPGKWLMQVESASFSYTPESEAIIPPITLSVGKTDRIAIIGPNGKGKTTLLNLLAGEYKPVSGNITYNDNTRLSYFGQTNIDRLSPANTVESEIAAVDPEKSRTIVRSICGAMMFEGDLALKKISVLSGGERSRVMLGKILVTPSNLLFLDEPTNHLDMQSIDSLVEAIEQFSGAVLIVTHSEMLLHRIANKLIVFDRGTVKIFDGTYQDFLDRVGWEEEDQLAPSRKRNTEDKNQKNSKKSYKTETADVIEKRIINSENRQKEINSRLVELSLNSKTKNKKTNDEISQLKSELDKLADQIEQDFISLSTLTN
ncbi:MAG TPA: ATP-binding cassette domain-containing protein [Oligoflexia bacterium]|nr:ATP-binding cassette domain-containing protein [Oligoflexia bacterium]HMP47338.1 ATP-binding cassette domain-containing protein [Oligoflexia bacterium]